MIIIVPMAATYCRNLTRTTYGLPFLLGLHISMKGIFIGNFVRSQFIFVLLICTTSRATRYPPGQLMIANTEWSFFLLKAPLMEGMKHDLTERLFSLVRLTQGNVIAYGWHQPQPYVYESHCLPPITRFWRPKPTITNMECIFYHNANKTILVDSRTNKMQQVHPDQDANLVLSFMFGNKPAGLLTSRCLVLL